MLARLIDKRPPPFIAAPAASKRPSAEARTIAWCDTTPPARASDLVLPQLTRNERLTLKTAARVAKHLLCTTSPALQA